MRQDTAIKIGIVVIVIWVYLGLAVYREKVIDRVLREHPATEPAVPTD